MGSGSPYAPLFPDLPLRRVEEMGLKELERIRLILRGGSVIEWRRLHFTTREEVDRFLRLCLLDPDDPEDQRWMRTVLADAVAYLRKTFNYKVAEAVANPEEIHDLFLYASGAKEPGKYRRIACIVLKVMHVIQHIEGREVLFKLEVSEAEIAEVLARRVAMCVQEMASKGIPVVEFALSFKSRDSLITKLLAKKETVAAQVYDKTRFRIVTRTKQDILLALYFLTQRLFPFNFVVPGQTVNSLISFKDLLSQYPNFAQHANELHLHTDYEEDADDLQTRNRFSGPGYRVLNFVVDIPIRVDPWLPRLEEDTRERKNRLAFGLVEFQIVDQETALQNEEGESSHEKYKQRQKYQVLRRLSRGLIVPMPAEKRKKRERSKKPGE
ncbi:MAG: TIGR04552 family protein [Myxococcaceae bacterium]|nr:TIGR04552 family protein [Myxococcaceae bacterium]